MTMPQPYLLSTHEHARIDTAFTRQSGMAVSTPAAMPLPCSPVQCNRHPDCAKRQCPDHPCLHEEDAASAYDLRGMDYSDHHGPRDMAEYHAGRALFWRCYIALVLLALYGLGKWLIG